jgi:beta-N-acetylhexosaminidase
MILDCRYWEGSTLKAPPPSLLALIQQYHPGGFILFQENFQTIEQSICLIDKLYQHATFPLLIGIDQEGGLIQRINFATETPGNRVIAETGQPDLAYQTGKLIATELKALGINMNFSPCLDVSTNHANTIINLRTFSDHSKETALYGEAMAKGLQSEGILTCGKHFPGHGGSQTDPHRDSSNHDGAWQDFQNQHLHPFAKIIEQCSTRLDAIMTAHFSAPALDNTLIHDCYYKKQKKPATFSNRIVDQILKKQIGHQGLVITDAMNMKAITRHFSLENAFIQAIKAGHDMVLMPFPVHSNQNINQFTYFMDHLIHAYQNDIHFQKRVDASFRKIARTKNQSIGPKIAKWRNQSMQIRINHARDIIHHAHHHHKAETIARSGIHLKKRQQLPSFNDGPYQILILDQSEYRQRHVVDYLQKNLVANFSQYRISCYSIDMGHANIRSAIKQAIKQSQAVLLFTQNLDHTTPLPETICQYIMEQHCCKLATIGCLQPYDHQYMPSSPLHINCYGSMYYDITNDCHRDFKLNLFIALEKLCQEMLLDPEAMKR